MKATQLLLVLAISVVTSMAQAAEVAVIVSASSELTEMSEKQLKKLYLGKLKTLPNGTEAKIYDYDKTSEEFDTFYKKVVKKTGNKLNAYWARKVFTGTGAPPEEKSTSEAMLEAVASDDGAIGFIPSGSVSDSVRVILTIE